MTENRPHLHSGKIDHHKKAAEMPPARIAVVTVSDSRTAETDVNGQYLKEKISSCGYILAAYHIVRDEPEEIEQLLESLTGLDVDVILFNGGTGISKRDSTYDVLVGKLEKVMPGFGELFRMLSFEQVGAAAMFSRATAGVIGKTIVFCMPGSLKACKLACKVLIFPELGHLVKHAFEE